MESKNLETLKPPTTLDNPFFAFPKHRKSHIKSNTFKALLRIFSAFGDDSLTSHVSTPIASDKPNSGVRCEELGGEDVSVECAIENDKSGEVVAIGDRSLSLSKIVANGLEIRANVGEECGLDSWVCSDGLMFPVEEVSALGNVDALCRLHFDELGQTTQIEALFEDVSTVNGERTDKSNEVIHIPNITVNSSPVVENELELRSGDGENCELDSRASIDHMVLPVDIVSKLGNDTTLVRFRCNELGQTQKEVYLEDSSAEHDRETDKIDEIIGLQSKTVNSSQVVANHLQELRVDVAKESELVSRDSFYRRTSLSLGNFDTLTNYRYNQVGIGQHVVMELKQGSQERMENEVFDCRLSEAVKSVQDTQDKNYCLDTIIDSSVDLIDNKDVEVGEIPDKLGVPCQFENLFPESSSLCKEGQVVEGFIVECLTKQLEFDGSRREHNAIHSGDLPTSYDTYTCRQEEPKERGIKKTFGVDNQLEVGINQKGDNGVKRDLVDYTDGLVYSEEISGKVMSENQTNTSIAKDDKVGIKRKRTVTKERKEKKKQTRRKNRAEMNKELGIKRLRLQPIRKPKTKKDCQFYLHGKCQKGDSCKFSHDLIPLTKSVCCKHFARRECMKGDACPYDHDLSKYPCHNFRDNGECNRGDACLFSHKILPLDGSSPASNINQPVGITNPDRQLNQRTTSHHTTFNLMPKGKTPPKTPSTGIFTHNLNTKKVTEMRPKAPAQAPKGITFLSFAKPPSVDSNKQLGVLTSGKDDIADLFGGKNNESASKKIQNAVMDNESKINSTPPKLESFADSPITVSKILQEFLFNGM
ncbi:hypothetical protein GIB67_041627 [Kingdonia uniflora]|uniref:C3H1-type domain-containing protein n=1 Tax=Kingdonia uniflora TaxID=39325 RepID=A0A7J7MQK8_9MAGN|nr:hypothetical protein GIB67_041627 [Kingdonia uniflora]